MDLLNSSFFIYISFVLGFLFLLYGARWLVDGSVSIARRHGLSEFVVGLTIVAIGTSAPELIVNILASIRGEEGIVFGNILGSNIANILLIGGIASISYPIAMVRATVWRELPFLILSYGILFVLSNDALFDGGARSELTQYDGLILLAFFALFIYYTIVIAKRNFHEKHAAVLKHTEKTSWQALFFIVIGLCMLGIGGNWVVDGAVHLAREIGISERAIALSVVAIGTSLPELAASITAIFRGSSGIAIGNIIGSNLFNLLYVLGISACIHSLSPISGVNFDILIGVIATVLLFICILSGKKYFLERHHGAIFILFYIAYLVYSFIKG